VPPGSGSFADVREIARAQVRGWREGRFGESFLLGGEHASFLELLTRVGAALGRPVPKRAMPPLALRAYARVQVASPRSAAASRRSRRKRRSSPRTTCAWIRQGDPRAGLPRNAAAGTARRHPGLDAQPRAC
jgi:nucleoside-diphosphate-sugar epimerase